MFLQDGGSTAPVKDNLTSLFMGFKGKQEKKEGQELWQSHPIAQIITNPKRLYLLWFEWQIVISHFEHFRPFLGCMLLRYRVRVKCNCQAHFYIILQIFYFKVIDFEKNKVLTDLGSWIPWDVFFSKRKILSPAGCCRQCLLMIYHWCSLLHYQCGFMLYSVPPSLPPERHNCIVIWRR